MTIRTTKEFLRNEDDCVGRDTMPRRQPGDVEPQGKMLLESKEESGSRQACVINWREGARSSDDNESAKYRIPLPNCA